MPLPQVTDDQRLVLDTIFRAYVDSDDWPTHSWLESTLEREGVDVNATLEQIEPGLYWPDWRPGGTVWYAAETQLGLRVAGLTVCRGAELHVREIVAVVRWLVSEWRDLPVDSPQSVPRVEKRTADLIEPLRGVVGGDPLVRDLKLMLELMYVEPGLPSWSGDPQDILARTFVIDRDVRRFSDVVTIEDLIDALRPATPTVNEVNAALELTGGPLSPALATHPAPVGVTASEARVAGVPPPLDAPVDAAPARRRRKYRQAADERFGRWTLRTQLGAGGNAEVWQAEDTENGEVAAVKILHADRTDDDAYARFRREVDSINELAAEGARVLPILDYYLPEDLTDAPWYAMPVAVPIRLALARASVVDRVAAFAELADELAHLAERGWHHRDIKPPNLYSHAGRFVVGDFGLIKRPDDEDLTRLQHVPGPYQYMPNEAVMRAPDIDRAAVDLFCLTKSLWVALTDHDRPPQGQISAASFWSLSRQVPDEAGVDELDGIVEQATSDDPADRGTFRDHADALAAWVVAQRAGEVITPPLRRVVRAPLEAAALPPLTADSPRELEALTVELLRRPDEVGLRELAREERRRLEEVVRSGVAAKYGSATYGDVAEFWRDVEPAFERVLAITLPLIANRSALWDDQLRWMARFAETRLLDQGLVLWIEMSTWCAWLFANCCGGFAMANDNLQVVGSLLTPNGATADGSPLGLLIPGESGVAVGVGVMSELDPQQRYLMPYHEYTLRYLASLEWMRNRYGEFAADQQTLRRAVDDFNFLATLAVAKAAGHVMASWSMGHDGAVELARRIRTSEAFRANIARAVGLGAEELAEQGNDLLRAGAIPPAGYVVSNAEL